MYHKVEIVQITYKTDLVNNVFAPIYKILMSLRLESKKVHDAPW